MAILTIKRFVFLKTDCLRMRLSTTWPGDVIRTRIRDAIADGVITAEEREYLTQTLQMLIGRR